MKRTGKGVHAKSNEMAHRQGTTSPKAASLFSQGSSRAAYICPDSEEETDDELYPPNVDVNVPRYRAGGPGEETQGSTTPENTGGSIRTPSPPADPAGELLFSNVGLFSLEADTEGGQGDLREPGQDGNSSGDDDDGSGEGAGTYDAIDAESEDVSQHRRGADLANKYNIMKVSGSHFHGKPPLPTGPPRGQSGEAAG